MTTQKAKLIVPGVMFAGRGIYWLMPWQRIERNWKVAEHNRAVDVAYERHLAELAEHKEKAKVREPDVYACLYDERIDGEQPIIKKVAPNGVAYEVYPGGGISWTGHKRPDIPRPAPPPKSYGRARHQMMKRIAELYVPQRHDPLADHVHEDAQGRYVLLDGTRIDVVQQ